MSIQSHQFAMGALIQIVHCQPPLGVGDRLADPAAPFQGVDQVFQTVPKPAPKDLGLQELPVIELRAGAQAETRQEIGWVIVGGLSLGTVLVLMIIPVVYLFLSRGKSADSGV